MTSRCQGLFPPTQFKTEKPWERGCTISRQGDNQRQIVRHGQTTRETLPGCFVCAVRPSVQGVDRRENCLMLDLSSSSAAYKPTHPHLRQRTSPCLAQIVFFYLHSLLLFVFPLGPTELLTGSGLKDGNTYANHDCQRNQRELHFRAADT